LRDVHLHKSKSKNKEMVRMFSSEAVRFEELGAAFRSRQVTGWIVF